MALSLAEFDGMVSDSGPALYRLAYRLVGDRHEAEDLVQEAFRSAWKSRELYRPEGGYRAWLAAILRRRVADHWRRPRPPTVTGGEHNLDVERPANDPSRDEFTDEIQRALGRLPPDLRETLLLVVVAELTHQEAAELLDVPLGTVLSRVSRARKRLRDLLIAANGVPPMRNCDNHEAKITPDGNHQSSEIQPSASVDHQAIGTQPSANVNHQSIKTKPTATGTQEVSDR
ncbi:MAG: RNA polymerase sigma factor [Thermoguttaceae bacterium]